MSGSIISRVLEDDDHEEITGENATNAVLRQRKGASSSGNSKVFEENKVEEEQNNYKVEKENKDIKAQHEEASRGSSSSSFTFQERAGVNGSCTSGQRQRTSQENEIVDLGPWSCLHTCSTVAERIDAIWGGPVSEELR